MVTETTVEPQDVWSMDWSAGEIQVRAWAPHPEPGTRVSFMEREWMVARTMVRTPGGRSCYVAYLTTPPDAS